MSEYIYELVDVTSDETNYTIGLFDSFKKANVEVLLMDNPVGEHGDCDCYTYEIRERWLNTSAWSITGKVVARYKMTLQDDEDLDESFWILEKEEVPNE